MTSARMANERDGVVTDERTPSGLGSCLVGARLLGAARAASAMHMAGLVSTKLCDGQDPVSGELARPVWPHGLEASR